MIPLARPSITEEEIKALNEAVNDRYVSGENVFKFEEEFARYIGTDYAISTSSGSSALFLSILALNIKSKIYTTPMSFIATSNSVIHANLMPKFVDITNENYNIDINKIPQEAECILPVHLYGNPANIDELKEKFSKTTIIEDACQGHGAILNNKKVGSIGDVGAFSFYTTKNMTVMGDGGMITTNDEKIMNKTKKLRDCGRVSQYTHDVIGYTMRLNSINAAVGRVQLRRLEDMISKRIEIANRYNKILSDVPNIVTPLTTNNSRHAYHLYVIRTDKRDELRNFLNENQIQTGIHYDPPIHLQPIYKELYNYKEGDFPVTEKHSREIISLPMFPELKIEEQNYICDKIKEFFKV